MAISAAARVGSVSTTRFRRSRSPAPLRHDMSRRDRRTPRILFLVRHANPRGCALRTRRVASRLHCCAPGSPDRRHARTRRAFDVQRRAIRYALDQVVAPLEHARHRVVFVDAVRHAMPGVSRAPVARSVINTRSAAAQRVAEGSYLTARLRLARPVRGRCGPAVRRWTGRRGRVIRRSAQRGHRADPLVKIAAAVGTRRGVGTAHDRKQPSPRSSGNAVCVPPDVAASPPRRAEARVHCSHAC